MKLFKKRGAKEHKAKESKIKGNSLGTAGFILGILSILSLGIIGIVLSIVGFTFCLIQQKNKPTKLATAGLILSIIGFVLGLVWIFYLAPILANWLDTLKTA
ncbi:hypothetical protein A3K82_02195 [Candidatus Pacearchaeota archaeon RBG_19FT_COMBO_34_9]|nr:MAG: hypothetical protein A3K82_02195 [Candidatus Pacearchaeota archaeon RBG_19FT_COMBO_34_9]OGJ16093.1 MAG: hypothetical protein A3K74_02575 [Candidatus Pacearchaeota archaeon RBG_13_33_26]